MKQTTLENMLRKLEEQSWRMADLYKLVSQEDGSEYILVEARKNLNKAITGLRSLKNVYEIK